MDLKAEIRKRKRLDAIKAAAQTHVNGAMRAQVAARLTEAPRNSWAGPERRQSGG
jgi:hypothetical protein